MSSKNIGSYLQLAFRLFHSVWKRDGLLGVRDHLQHFFKIRYQRLSRKRSFLPRKIAFLSECPGAAMRYRCDHAVEQLSNINIEAKAYEINAIDFEACVAAHQVVVLHRVLHTPAREKIIRSAQKSGKTFVFDTDDLIFNLDKVDSIRKLPKVQFEFLMGEFERLQKMLKCCNYAIGSTEKMKEELEVFLPGRCFVHENMVSDKAIEESLKVEKLKSSKGRNSQMVTLGYASGTRTHDDDFAVIAQPLLRLLKAHPQTKLQIVGHLNLPDSFEAVSAQVETKKLQPWKKLPKALAQFDINLAPLEDLELNEAKSDLKFFEAATVATPTVATDIGAFSKNIRDGETGLLAKNEKEWFEKLETLILEESLRKKIGEKAYAYVKKERNSEKGAKNFQKILKQIEK